MSLYIVRALSGCPRRDPRRPSGCARSCCRQCSWSPRAAGPCARWRTWPPRPVAVKVRPAGGPASQLPGPAQAGQQHHQQQPHDADHHEQFDKRESGSNVWSYSTPAGRDPAEPSLAAQSDRAPSAIIVEHLARSKQAQRRWRTSPTAGPLRRRRSPRASGPGSASAHSR